MSGAPGQSGTVEASAESQAGHGVRGAGRSLASGRKGPFVPPAPLPDLPEVSGASLVTQPLSPALGWLPSSLAGPLRGMSCVARLQVLGGQQRCEGFSPLCLPVEAAVAAVLWLPVV